MKTSKIWRPDLGRYVEVDYEIVQKVQAASKLRKAQKLASQPSFFQRVNIIDLAFRLFFFFGIVCPIVIFCAYAIGQSLYHDLGAQQFFQLLSVLGVIVGVMFILVVLCYLSQIPASQLTFGYAISTFVKAIIMTPIALIGSFFVAKAPQGTVAAGGIAADMVRDAGEIIDKVKHR